MPQIIDGKALAQEIRKETATSAQDFQRSFARRPRLAAILVGDNPASHVYVRNKVKACEDVGIESESHHLPASTSQEELQELIRSLNLLQGIDGILLQLPLPDHIDKTAMLDVLSPDKDVDGLHPVNVGLLVQGRATLIACTPLGVIEALKRSQIKLNATNAVVVGRSDLVGKPLALLLLHENATVTVCHSKTADLANVVSSADLVVAAMGRPGFITADFIKRGAVIVDVGTTVLQSEEQVARIFGSGSKKMEDFRNKKNVLVGDCHPSAYEKSSFYTPVPGGVGPLTIAMLLRNTVRAAFARTV